MSILLRGWVGKGMMPSWNNFVKLVTDILVLRLFEVSSKSFSELFCDFSPCTIDITVINNIVLSTLLEKVSKIFDMKDWLNNRVKIAKARLVFESNLSFFYYINLWSLLIIFKARRYIDAWFIMNLILSKTYLTTRKSLSF